MFTRRRMLGIGFAAGASALAYPTVLEPRWLDVTHTSLPNPHSAPTARILHLSDLHASWCVPWSLMEAAVRDGLAQHPDLICLTGDFVTDGLETDTNRYIRVLRTLSAAKPTFAVLGNHDGGSWSGERGGYSDYRAVERLLETAHVELLHNRSRQLDLASGRINLLGVGDYWSNEVDPRRAGQALVPTESTLALCHNPDAKDLLSPLPWQLMLCGHTHGGQVMIPFEGPRYAPVIDKRYVSGLNPYEDRYIYTTRGVGSLGGVRFGCRPEVTILEFPLLSR
ncbi:MAG: phosphodiesterase YaeI [Acidobacteriota bacterium]